MTFYIILTYICISIFIPVMLESIDLHVITPLSQVELFALFSGKVQRKSHLYQGGI